MGIGRRALVTGGLAWTLLGGCGESGAQRRGGDNGSTAGRKGGRMTSIDFPGLSVRVALAVDKAAATLTYEARASGADTIFLLDGIHNGARGGKLQMRDAPWVYLDEDAVRLTARFHGPPPGSLVPALNVPIPTRLAPGEQVRRTLAVALPLLGDEPHRHFDRPPVPQTRVLPVFFELGWFVGRPGVEAMAKSVETSEGPRMAFSAVSERGQQVGRLGPLGELPVITNAMRA